MKIAAGQVEQDAGTRFIKPGITLRYLEQEPDFSGYSDIRSWCEAGLVEGDAPHRVGVLLEELGLSGNEDPATLSGGEGRRAALVRVMAPDPDILLLDEPTNHLDLPVIDWLETTLARSRAAIVLISHDRQFLKNMTKRTLWLDRGTTKELDKGFAHFENWRDEVLEKEELDAHKLDRKIVREEHWITYGVTARRKRNVRRLKELDGLRAQRRDRQKIQGGIKITATASDASGKLVIEADEICKSYDGRCIVDKFSIRINRGDRIGFAGANGTGKTTLLHMITGKLAPDSGTVRLGTNLEMIGLDQRREALEPTTRLIDVLTGGRGDMVTVGDTQRHVMSYLKDFLFTSDQARSPVSALSGGERGRLAMAMALAKPSNLLVLDEPTNDLDLETLDLLEEMLSQYQGTVLLVSHDRDFLDRIVTSTITPEGQGKWREYPGGYSDMIRQKKNERTQERQVSGGTASSKSNQDGKNRTKTSLTKLSYKEKYALENLPQEMEKLTTKISQYQAKMANPELFTKNPDQFKAASEGLEAAKIRLGEIEEQWLELEMKREALEGA